VTYLSRTEFLITENFTRGILAYDLVFYMPMERFLSFVYNFIISRENVFIIDIISNEVLVMRNG